MYLPDASYDFCRAAGLRAARSHRTRWRPLSTERAAAGDIAFRIRVGKTMIYNVASLTHCFTAYHIFELFTGGDIAPPVSPRYIVPPERRYRRVSMRGGGGAGESVINRNARVITVIRCHINRWNR